MNAKKAFMFSFIILIAFLLIACNSQDKNNTPEIKAVFTFSNLTDDDFSYIGTSNVAKEDFRKVSFSLTVKNSANLPARKISIPDIKDAMNSYDMKRYWYGQYTTMDSPAEDAEYIYDIMFLSKDLREEEIKDMFRDRQIFVTWTDKDKTEEMRAINLSDIISFQ